MSRFTQFWWTITITGLILLSLGSMLLANPQNGLDSLIQYIGYLAIGMGAFTTLINYLVNKKGHKTDNAWYFIGSGELVFGVLVITYLQESASVFTQGIGIWAILLGLWLLFVGIRSKQKAILTWLNAVVSVVMGALILAQPFEQHKMNLLIGLYTVLLGVYALVVSLRMRKAYKLSAKATISPEVTKDLDSDDKEV